MDEKGRGWDAVPIALLDWCRLVAFGTQFGPAAAFAMRGHGWV